MDDWTPDTEHIRGHYDDRFSPGDFDRWLVEHDREVEARGLEKAMTIGRAVEAEAVEKRDDSDYPESHYGQHLDGQARGAQVVAKRISLVIRAQQVREGNK